MKFVLIFAFTLMASVSFAFQEAKIYSGRCGEYPALEGSGLRFGYESKDYIVTSQRVVLHSNQNYCHSVVNRRGEKTPLKFLRAEYMYGLALLEVQGPQDGPADEQSRIKQNGIAKTGVVTGFGLGSVYSSEVYVETVRLMSGLSPVFGKTYAAQGESLNVGFLGAPLFHPETNKNAVMGIIIDEIPMVRDGEPSSIGEWRDSKQFASKYFSYLHWDNVVNWIYRYFIPNNGFLGIPPTGIQILPEDRLANRNRVHYGDASYELICPSSSDHPGQGVVGGGNGGGVGGGSGGGVGGGNGGGVGGGNGGGVGGGNGGGVGGGNGGGVGGANGGGIGGANGAGIGGDSKTNPACQILKISKQRIGKSKMETEVRERIPFILKATQTGPTKVHIYSLREFMRYMIDSYDSRNSVEGLRIVSILEPSTVEIAGAQAALEKIYLVNLGTKARLLQRRLYFHLEMIAANAHSYFRPNELQKLLEPEGEDKSSWELMREARPELTQEIRNYFESLIQKGLAQ